MSTRATYKINGYCFYIHCDGYKEGAAASFWNMLHSENQKGGDTERFFRANPTAVLTESHEIHGDTEFRYTLIANHLTVSESNDFGDTWKPSFKGDIWDFINQYKCQIENYSPVTYLGNSNKTVSVYSLRQVLEMAEAELSSAIDLLERGHFGNGSHNLGNCERFMSLIEVALEENPDFMEPERNMYSDFVSGSLESVRKLSDICRVNFNHSCESWAKIEAGHKVIR